MIIEDCKHCEHYVADAYGDKVCAFDGDCENYVQTNEEFLRSASANDMATMIATKLLELARHEYGMCDVVDRDIVLGWLKQPHG